MNDISLNFSRYEFACSDGCGLDTVDAELVKVLEGVRGEFKAPITITGGNRCEKQNEKVGGAITSKHLVCQAADFRVEGVPADEVAEYLMRLYPAKYGIGRYTGRTHIDVRPVPARWDKRNKP